MGAVCGRPQADDARQTGGARGPAAVSATPKEAPTTAPPPAATVPGSTQLAVVDLRHQGEASPSAATPRPGPPGEAASQQQQQAMAASLAAAQQGGEQLQREEAEPGVVETPRSHPIQDDLMEEDDEEAAEVEVAQVQPTEARSTV